MTCEMTDVDIRNAQEAIELFHMRSLCCPVAQCVRRITKAKRVNVLSEISVDRREFYAYGTDVANFISDFDGGKPVEPITFELNRMEIMR